MSPKAPIDAAEATRHSATTWLFVAFTWGLSLWVGHAFFEAMRGQLFLSDAAHGRLEALTPWSAPLDDVFIHFDFARSTARGYPFEWSEGNGYSSGGTSLLYPFVLAVGYWLGYQGTSLMLWAGIIATASVTLTLCFTRGLMRPFAPPLLFILPPLFLSVGGLNWSLFSGMEVAFFLAVWAACFYRWDACLQAPPGLVLVRSAWLGVACVVLVATRPESAPIVACFAFTSLAATWRRTSPVQRLACLAVIGVPAAVVLVVQAVANHAYTGEWTAAGGLVKLEMNHPYLTRSEVWDAWVFHVRYQIARITNHHLSSSVFRFEGVEVSAGWLIWAFALVPLLQRKTRTHAILLWLCLITWMMTVALNGHVRWQNERYAMPEVAWLLLGAGVGFASVLEPAIKGLVTWVRPARSAALAASTLVAALLYATLSRAQYRDQLWFFGRAARNISDQQVTAGRQVRALRGHRILVGDAGAIPYISDLPAIDLIGLGGYHDLPFAKASRLGLGAGIELLQRLPEADRPDLMAIYPSWWGMLPTWFGERIVSIPAPGNVICGGQEKVIYRANFSALVGTDSPTNRPRRDFVQAELDFADLVSERAAHTQFHGTPGYVTMKLLPHPNNSKADLWDAGRILPPDTSVSFKLGGLVPHEPAKVLLRIAPGQASEVELSASGKSLLKARLAPSAGWQEVPLAVPKEDVSETVLLTLRSTSGETILYHLWILQER
jgi:hypothetical protein